MSKSPSKAMDKVETVSATKEKNGILQDDLELTNQELAGAQPATTVPRLDE